MMEKKKCFVICDAPDVMTEAWFNDEVLEYFIKDLVVKFVIFHPSLAGNTVRCWDRDRLATVASSEEGLVNWDYYIADPGVRVRIIFSTIVDADEVGFLVRPRNVVEKREGAGG